MNWLCDRLTKGRSPPWSIVPWRAEAGRTRKTAFPSPVSLSSGHKDSATGGNFPTTSWQTSSATSYKRSSAARDVGLARFDLRIIREKQPCVARVDTPECVAKRKPMDQP